MEIETTDAHTALALERALAHPPPFTSEECAKIDSPLVIKHARDISPVQHCVNLSELEIFASEIDGLDALAGLSHLKKLRVACSKVENIQALSRCRMLETIDLTLNLVEDLSPLLALPRLRRGILLGNPWTPESYREIRLKLLQTPSEYWQRRPALDFSSETEWQLTRRLYERGFQACFARLDNRSVLIRPGIPTLTSSDCDFIELPANLIRLQLERHGYTIADFFKEFSGHSGPDAPPASFDFRPHRIIGTNEDATDWVHESSLPDSAKRDLLRFVRRFPRLLFYKEDATFLDWQEAALGVELPQWLREIREVLAYVMPHHTMLAQFDGFDYPSTHSEPGHLWYSFGLRTGSQEQQRSIDKHHLLIIGQGIDNAHSSLALNLAASEDQRVYEADPGEINQSRVLPESLRPAFDSYAGMLSRISALKIFPDGEVMRAVAGI